MFKLELFYVFSLYFSYMFYVHFYNFVLVFKPLRSFGLTVCSGHKRFWRVGLARGEASVTLWCQVHWIHGFHYYKV